MDKEYLLEIKNLYIWEKDKGKKESLVKNLSIKLPQGKVIAIIGQTGSGKTLISKAIMGMLAKNLSASGEILFEGKDLMNFSEDNWTEIRGKKIGISFQNPESSLNPLLKNKRQLQLSMRENFKYVDKRLKRLFFNTSEDILKKYPFELSGGMAQRFMIALALGSDVKLLIFDEPTRGLDLLSTKRFYQMVKSLVRNKNIGVLLLSHDNQLVDKLADYTYVINRGEICEENISHEIFRQPKSSYSKDLFAKDPKFHRIVEFPYKRLALLKKNYPNLTDKEVLRVINLSAGYKKSIFSNKVDYIFKDVNFHINEGEVVGLFGESGCGKSTIASCILGLIDYKGRIFFNGKKDHKSEIQIVRQKAANSFIPNTPIINNFKEIFKIHKDEFIGQNLDEIIKNSLKEVNLEELYSRLDEFPNKFSGGQLQRLAIARVLLIKTKLLILDEASSMLDLKTQADIINLIIKLQLERKLSILFISHDKNLMEQVANRIYVMKKNFFQEIQYERM